MVPDPILGTTLGRDYRVLEEIGRGGMAVVYLVEHQTLLKQFAVKVLSAELAANFEARARFTQEAHAASQLDHENIVTISDFGVSSDQRPFFVMELLRGKTLDQRIADGPMSIEEIAAVAIPIGRALAHAHAEGVVHRDVKPENIFLVQRSQGRFGVKVVDFGIAKAPVHNQKLTKMGQTLGSPMFMAPEACRGDDVDHRADIYSLGILLYLMCCGRVPFQDASLLKVLQMQVSSPLPPPRSLAPDLSPELEAVIVHALQKNPDDRFPSMVELLDAFEAALPPGADRLLLEAQRGTTQAIRTTPFPGVTLAARTSAPSIGASQSSLPPVVPARRTNRVVVAIAFLCIAAAVLGVVFAVQRTGGDASASKTATPTGSATVARDLPGSAGPAPTPSQPTGDPKPASDPKPSGDSKPTGEVTPPTEVTPPAPAKVALRVTSTPTGATVTLDGNKIGLTPIDLEVERAERTAELVISRRGYGDVTRKIDLRAPAPVEVSLSATPKVTGTKPPRNDSKKPVPTDVKPPPPKGDPSLDIRLSR